ncbi:MAG TPA: type II secretion system F family protein [Planctomycetaceae bacterium]|jgi:type II secretory pathway component PulF|nr:type II secretion system F family protein [Planctomycetaceae bacterium]
MTAIVAIVYSILCLQLCLGVAMIATASIASNRQMNAGSRLIDGLLRVIGRGSFALGLWAIVCSLGARLYVKGGIKFDLATILIYVAALAYSVLILSGGWLQSRVATALLFPPPIAEQRRVEYRITLLRGIGWTLAIMPFGPLAAVYFLLAAFFGGAVRVQQESLLLILAVAMRTHAPLSEECEALADASRGRFRRRLRQLASRLRRGDRLSDALRAIPGLAPAATVTALRLAEDMGNVTEVANQEALRFRRREESRLEGRFSMAGLTFYVFSFFVLAAAVICFLIYWVEPRFGAIFRDFNSPVPAPTRALVDAQALLFDYWFLIVAACFGTIVWGLYVLLHRGGWSGLNWSVASSVYPRLQTPGVLRSLAQTVVCHQPLSLGVQALEVHHPHRGIRNRMRRLREQIVRGNNGFQPLADAGLLSGREADALACAERAGNLAWVLESLADNIERRHRSFQESVVETVQPAVIAAIGLLVLAICVGIFYPIIQLIQVSL